MIAAQNRLLLRLKPAERRRLLSRCETVPLALGDMLSSRGSVGEHVYFPIEGYVSMLVSAPEGGAIEVGLVGGEGMLGAQFALGLAITPFDAMVQGAGSAHRLDAASFKEELALSARLVGDVHRYVYVLLDQLANGALCNRFHPVRARLARWLLMTHDRALGDTFRMTHEFLSLMLGVRRVGVTEAASELHRLGCIEYRRGEIQIHDRDMLEAQACSCYQGDRLTYAKVFA